MTLRTIHRKGPAVLLATAWALAQEGEAVQFDPRYCWGCDELTLEGVGMSIAFAAAIGAILAIVRAIANRHETYQYRGLALKID